MAEDKAALKPCPFCGSANKLHLRDIAGWELDCECGASMVLNDDPSRDGLVAHWNTRTPDVDALVVALEAMICRGCNNRIGYTGESDSYGNWQTCTSCKAARTALAAQKD